MPLTRLRARNQRRRVRARQGGGQHHVHGRAAAPVPSLFRGFSAPVKVSLDCLERGPARSAAARHGCVQPLAGGAERRDAPLVARSSTGDGRGG